MDWRHQELLTGVHNSASLDRVPQCIATFQGDHEHALSTGDSYGRTLVHIAVGSGGAGCSQIITFLAKVGCDINDCNNVWHAPPLVSSIYWNLHGMVSEHDACASKCAEARWTFRKPRGKTAEVSRSKCYALAQASSASTEAFGILRAGEAKRSALRGPPMAE